MDVRLGQEALREGQSILILNPNIAGFHNLLYHLRTGLGVGEVAF
jgi:hypothetical protein